METFAKWLRCVAATALYCALGACGLVKLREESQTYYSSTVLVGRIDCQAGISGPVIVLAYTLAAERLTIAHQTMLHECGGYELIVPRGDYRLFAVHDANANRVFDAGEAWGAYLGPALISASGSGVIAALDFGIPAHWELAPPVPFGTAFGGSEAGHRSAQVGAVADLDAPEFSADSGSRGYWAPVEFFRQGGGNIHFLAPYDPVRIPILFVHGAVGSPQDWRYFFEHLDRTRYQGWFFQYPSGASLNSMAYLLYWKLLNLQLRYRFETLYIVAHSMGGLVVRDFLLNFGSQFPQIKLFVSLSTPWAGETTAELGVKHSPAVVPSWVDMQPAGPFIQTLFARKLPPHVAHFLFFGHKGGYSLLRPNNDGTVTLASQLRGDAQAEARMVYGFEEDHVGILSSPRVLGQFQAVLASLQGTGGAPRPGQVAVNFSFAGADDGPRGLPLLWLRPAAESAAAETRRADALIIPMAAHDSGRRIGPIPPGCYDASLIAAAFRSDPPVQRMCVDADQATALNFRLVPEGMLSGYVGADPRPSENPAGSYHAPHTSVRIVAITLTGAGQQRRLIPRQDGEADLLQRFMDGVDDAYKAQFSFVGLPAGEYELTITAHGYMPYRARHTVVPGQPGQLRPIVLTPEP